MTKLAVQANQKQRQIANAPGFLKKVEETEFADEDRRGIELRFCVRPIHHKPKRSTPMPRTSLRFPTTLLCCALLLSSSCAAAADGPQFSDVFVAGQDGFKSIRIPAALVTAKGTVLAFAEGRKTKTDQANNKLILKRSHNGGQKWEEQQIIADDGANCLNNPCVVQDRTSGRILLMFQSYPASLSEHSDKIATGVDGPNIVRNYLITSDDDGATWTKMLDVTKTTKRPEVVTTIASGPGIGIQLSRGLHKGRLIIPFNEGPVGKWNVFALHSDDGGASWHIGQIPPGCQTTNDKGANVSTVNEVQMVELSDGGVLLNSRRASGKAVRKIATSNDGGESWSKIGDDDALRDPTCMASVYRYSFAKTDANEKADAGTRIGGKSRILYCGPDSNKRENGTIRLSYDEGQTWPVKKVLSDKSFAYSVLASFADGTVGCLFETDNTDRIVFARLTLDWLTDGKDQGQ